MLDSTAATSDQFNVIPVGDGDTQNINVQETAASWLPKPRSQPELKQLATHNISSVVAGILHNIQLSVITGKVGNTTSNILLDSGSSVSLVIRPTRKITRATN